MIIRVSGEITAAYFAFPRDCAALRANAKAVSKRLKKLPDGSTSGWKNLDKVMGNAAVKRMMEDAFGASDPKTFNAVAHFALVCRTSVRTETEESRGLIRPRHAAG